MLVVMAGLPGSGKSAVAEDVGIAFGCAVLSVDPVEAAMWRSGVSRSEPTGLAAYVVVETLAAEQLSLGHDVVVDAVNAVEPARDQWRALAQRTGSVLRFIEVRCSDPTEHRRRLAARQRDIAGFPEPSWESVEQRRADFEDWSQERLVLDSLASRQENLQAVINYLAADLLTQRPDL